MASKTSTPSRLTEIVDNRGVDLRVDAEAGVVFGVKVLGFKSSNGRRYTESAVQRAIGMYEGAKVNIDHPEGANDRPRSYGDRFGRLANIRQAEDGLYGDLKYNPKHRLAEQFAWDAMNASDNLGLSHNVMARTSKSGGQVVVEEIVKVNSVDLVADPATTRGLFEHEEQSMELTLESVRADAGIVKQLREEWLTEMRASDEHKATQEQIKTLTEQLAESKKKLDEFEVKEKLAAKKATFDKLISEAKLPDDAVTEIFREQVYAAADEAAAKRIIEDRAAIAKLAGGGKVQSRSQHVTESVDASGLSSHEDVLRFVRG